MNEKIQKEAIKENDINPDELERERIGGKTLEEIQEEGLPNPDVIEEREGPKADE